MRGRTDQSQRLRFLGGLPIVRSVERAFAVLSGLVSGGAVIAVTVGCDDGSEKPRSAAPRERSQAVVVAAGQEQPAGHRQARSGQDEKKTEVPSGQAKPAPKARPLCEARQPNERKAIDKKRAMARAAAPGEAALPNELPVGGGHATWVNFWAAWCVPCKEEIPRLLAWEKTLTGEGIPFRVVFVSLDDDERQLRDFLAQQDADGLRRTYWLREGVQREEWLAQVGMDTDPRLPVHLLANAKGETYCVVDGAVEDGDLDEVRRLARAASQ